MAKSDPILLPMITLEDVLRTGVTPFDRAVKKCLYQTLGEEIYKTWFHHNKFVAKSVDWQGEPIFSIDGEKGFVKNYVLYHYEKQMNKAFNPKEEKETAACVSSVPYVRPIQPSPLEYDYGEIPF